MHHHKQHHQHNHQHNHHHQSFNEQANIAFYFKKAYKFIIDLYFFVPTCSFIFQLAVFIFGLYTSTTFTHVYQNTVKCPGQSIQGVILAMCSLIFVHFLSGIVDLILRCFNYWTGFVSRNERPHHGDFEQETTLFKKLLNAFFFVRLAQYILETIVELFITVYLTIAVMHSRCNEEHPLFYKYFAGFTALSWAAVLVNLFLFQYCVFPMFIVVLSYLYEWFYMQRYGVPIHQEDDDDQYECDNEGLIVEESS